ncbi:Uncharacterised protein [Lysinibacillus capsici]|uniref:Uncharacterized protein n=1 Tax=Lysinibacillus capsici TaxID=2115968 RepID=A0A2X1A1X4_9BACI|nr:Uncharacterised protein [Lysinibacillus capsici]
MQLVYEHPILTLLFISAIGFWLTAAFSQLKLAEK